MCSTSCDTRIASVPALCPNFICQCCARMWAAIPLAKDIDFSWALWYGKCPRSFVCGHTYETTNEDIIRGNEFNLTNKSWGQF